MVSTPPYTCVLEQLPLWEWWAERILQGQGGDEAALTAQVQLSGQQAVTSPCGPSPTVTSNKNAKSYVKGYL